MPKYRVVFTETCRYEVEVQLTSQPEQVGAWFHAVDQCAPNWADKLVAIEERQLVEVEEI